MTDSSRQGSRAAANSINVGEGFALPQANLLHTAKSTEGARTVSTTDTVEKSLLREGKALPYGLWAIGAS